VPEIQSRLFLFSEREFAFPSLLPQDNLYLPAYERQFAQEAGQRKSFEVNLRNENKRCGQSEQFRKTGLGSGFSDHVLLQYQLSSSPH